MRGVHVAVSVFAIVVCACFVIGIRQAHDTNVAQSILTATDSITPSQVAKARSLLKSAGQLNPDRTVGILRTELAISENRLADAQRIIGGVISAEPENLDAYYWLAKASRDRPALFLLAELKIHQLEPPIRSHP